MQTKIAVVPNNSQLKTLLCTTGFVIVPGLLSLYLLRSVTTVFSLAFQGYLFAFASYTCICADKITTTDLRVHWYEDTYLSGIFVGVIFFFSNLLYSSANNALGVTLVILLADLFYLGICLIVICAINRHKPRLAKHQNFT